MKRATTALLLLLLTACATKRGFDRGALSRDLRPDATPVTDEDIAKALAVKPQVTVPFKLAVYFRPVKDRYGYAAQRWTGDDKDAVIDRLGALVAEGALAQVIPVAEEVAAGHDLRSIRLAAARYGADAVLLVNGAGQVDRYNTAVSALYWTIIGAFVAPGTKADALFLTTATLWDVRSEYLYASAEAEGTETATGTPLTVSDERVMAKARTSSVAALAQEIEQRVRSVTGTPRRAGN